MHEPTNQTPSRERSEGSDQGAPAAVPVREKRTSSASAESDKPPPYRVILHNDDINDMAYVVESVVELTPHGRTRAIELMLTAHKAGRAALLVTHKERAELYVEQFQSKRLIASMEQAG